MQITHGTFTLRGNNNCYAAVQLLDLPGFVQGPANPMPGPGIAGTVTLVAPPHVQNFAVNNTIDYSDGNNNNNKAFTVTSVVGPSKYRVVTQ